MSKQFWRWHAPVVAWAMIILVLTWYPKLEVPDTGLNAQDKVAHLSVFALLGILAIRALTKYEINRLSHAVKVTLLYGTSFAIVDEALQALIPGRSADLFDALANIAGVLVSAIVFRYIVFPIHKRYGLY